MNIKLIYNTIIMILICFSINSLGATQQSDLNYSLLNDSNFDIATSKIKVIVLFEPITRGQGKEGGGGQDCKLLTDTIHSEIETGNVSINQFIDSQIYRADIVSEIMDRLIEANRIQLDFIRADLCLGSLFYDSLETKVTPEGVSL